MPGFDPSVLAQIPGYGPDPMKAVGAGLNLANAAQGYESGQIDLQNQRQQQADTAQARQALQGVDLNDPAKANAALMKISDPNIRMKVMAQLNSMGQQKREITIQDMEIADRKLDQLAKVTDPIVAQLDMIAQQKGQTPDMLNARAKQLIIPAVLQLRNDHPELAPEIDRFLQDPNHLTYQGLKSVDAQTKWGSQAIKDRLAERRQQETERENRERDKDRDRRASEGAGELSPEAQRLKDDLAARDPSFMARAGAKSITQQNRILEDWAKEGRTADAIIGSRQATAGTKSEVTALYKQKAQLERTEKSIADKGGFLDQAEEAVKEVDLSKVKALGTLDTWRMESVTDPALKNYHAAITELRAEYAIVLSKGGQVTNESREEAKGVVSDYQTPASFARIRERIEQGIKASSGAVDESISEATRGASTPGGGGGGPRPPSGGTAAPSGWGKATVVQPGG